MIFSTLPTFLSVFFLCPTFETCPYELDSNGTNITTTLTPPKMTIIFRQRVSQKSFLQSSRHRLAQIMQGGLTNGIRVFSSGFLAPWFDKKHAKLATFHPAKKHHVFFLWISSCPLGLSKGEVSLDLITAQVLSQNCLAQKRNLFASTQITHCYHETYTLMIGRLLSFLGRC